MQKKSVNTIIQNSKGKYLLQMRDSAPNICNPLKWNFFGGGMKETNPLLGAIREMREELGIVADKEDLVLVGKIEKLNSSKVYIVQYKKKVNWGEFTLHEGAGAGYFTKEEIMKIESTDNAKLIVQSYL